MGRRSINTTKSGKYMNPTDQARKEARKKELKKNKKQRLLVRQAVLKGKDPGQILDEMEKIDDMEFNVLQPSPLNEKVLKEKRKKLKETFDRVMKLYHTEDPELWTEIKRKEVEYEKRRNKRMSYFESVRQAQSIQVEDIPLPSAKETPTPMALPRINLPPPTLIIPPVPQAMLNQIPPAPAENEPEPQIDEEELMRTPGCPPMPPPNLNEMPDLDSDYDQDLLPKNRNKKRAREEEVTSLKPPNELQQKMLALSGQNIDDFMKEMENVQRKKEAERAAGRESESEDSDAKGDGEEDDDDDDDDNDEEHAPPKAPQEEILNIPPPPEQPATLMIPPPMRPQVIPPPPFPVFPPPMMRGMMPGMPGPGPPRMHGPRMGPRMGLRPPGPPPGMPPKFAQKGGPMQQGGPGGSQMGGAPKDPKSATITAKPQIRNLSADVTRFVPTTLRIKKDEPRKVKPKPVVVQQPTQPTGPTKDDAYMQFMREMQGFL